VPPSVSAVHHPNSVEATTRSGLMGFRRAYLPATPMTSSMCAHDSGVFPGVDCPGPRCTRPGAR
jgi:hypothetical protein